MTANESSHTQPAQMACQKSWGCAKLCADAPVDLTVQPPSVLQPLFYEAFLPTYFLLLLFFLERGFWWRLFGAAAAAFGLLLPYTPRR
mmetsp:Transcript_24593/g.52392  ORF Transcript_24593/g.52392 Transcript_24593/m.52392 type:complete len:88 (+) Transcript_24593:445-708(+)